jgi:hypothetical protein
MELNSLSGFKPCRELRAAMKAIEDEILAIFSSSEQNAIGVDRFVAMKDLVERNDHALRLARQHRDEFDPERLEPVIAGWSASTLRRLNIADRDVIRVASCIFVQFARRVLEFIPIVDAECDPSNGLKLWMYTYDSYDVIGLPLVYTWPNEASLLVKVEDFGCQNQRVRTALMCLANSGYGSFYFSSPLAVVDNSDKDCWPIWPPEHGPYTLRPPSRIEDFLRTITLGLPDGASKIQDDEPST